MSAPSQRRRISRALCAEVHPDDDVDPRNDQRERANANRHKPDRKLEQFCKQVFQTIQPTLANYSPSSQAGSLGVYAVRPAPDARRLLVVVTVTRAAERDDTLRLLGSLAAGLRRDVAAAISRRRVPELEFEVIVQGAEGG